MGFQFWDFFGERLQVQDGLSPIRFLIFFVFSIVENFQIKKKNKKSLSPMRIDFFGFFESREFSNLKEKTKKCLSPMRILRGGGGYGITGGFGVNL